MGEKERGKKETAEVLRLWRVSLGPSSHGSYLLDMNEHYVVTLQDVGHYGKGWGGRCKGSQSGGCDRNPGVR